MRVCMYYVINENQQKIKLRCQRCFNEWEYQGSNPFYAICSFCRTTVSIKKNRIQADAVIGVSHQPDFIRRGYHHK